MANLTKMFGTDEEAEEQGVWADLENGLRLKVARWNNPVHRAALERLQRPYRSQLGRGSLPLEIQDRIVVDSMAEGILHGWENVEDEGVAVPWTRENAKRLLAKYKDFRDLVSSLASDRDRYVEAEVEAAAKN